MDLAVARRRDPARSHHGGPALEADAQLALDRLGEFRPLNRRNQLRESRTVFEGGKREGTRMGDQGIIGIDRRHRIGPDEAGHHCVSKGLLGQRRGFKGIQVDRQSGHGPEIIIWRAKKQKGQ